jgi:hypothetical protein
MFAVVTEDKIALAEGTSAYALQGINTAGIAFDNGHQFLVIRPGHSQRLHGGA